MARWSPTNFSRKATATTTPRSTASGICSASTPAAALPARDIDAVKMGTTVATNALLERKGDRTVFVTTRGFADALRIAWQHRPKLFVRRIDLPSMLYEETIEVDERSARTARSCARSISTPRRSRCARAFDRGIRACAIVLMHGYRLPGPRTRSSRRSPAHRLHADLRLAPREPAHEARLARRHDGRRRLSIARAAALRAARRGRAARHPRLQFMQSSGGLSRRELLSRQGRDPVGSRGRHRRRGAGGAVRGIREDHRVRHGRHLDGRRSLRGRREPTTTSARSTSKSRACGCARRSCASTPSRRAAARSAASTACGCVSARNPPARTRDPRRIVAADRSPSPTATCC